MTGAALHARHVAELPFPEQTALFQLLWCTPRAPAFCEFVWLVT
jgi:hypothetical protein